MQGCEEKEKVLLLWERALTLFYENDTELFVTGAQERTIAGKIAMHMDKIYREIFPMPELVIDIEYNRMDTGIKPKYPGSEDKKKRWTAPDIVLHKRRSMLNDENVPVPSVYNKENKAYGKETTYTIAPVILWDSSRVWKILTAYVYTGAMVLGKTKTLISGKSIIRTVPKGQRYITEGTHEAIVSREEFEKAQLVIKSNSHKVLMGSVDFPLKGKVRCGNCRRVMAHNFKQAVPTFWCREGLELVGQTQCTSEVFQVSDIENAVFQALKKELSLLDSLYGDIQKEEQDLKEVHKKANRRKTLMEQELKNLKGEKMRMYEEYAAGTLPLDTYKQKKQECDRRISEVQEQIEQSQAEESAESVVPGTVRAAAEQAENFLHGTRLTAGMVSAFIENVFVHDGGRIVVRFKYEQSIQDTVKALQTG